MPLQDCFWIFSFILLFLATQWTNRSQVFSYFWTCFNTAFKHDEYHEFCNWKTILCETNKNLLKLTGKHLYTGVSFLTKLHEHKTQTKPCKLYMLIAYINSLNKQDGWGAKQYLHNEKKLCFLLSDYSFKGRGSSQILIIQ